MCTIVGIPDFKKSPILITWLHSCITWTKSTQSLFTMVNKPTFFRVVYNSLLLALFVFLGSRQYIAVSTRTEIGIVRKVPMFGHGNYRTTWLGQQNGIVCGKSPVVFIHTCQRRGSIFRLKRTVEVFSFSNAFPACGDKVIVMSISELCVCVNMMFKYVLKDCLII